MKKIMDAILGMKIAKVVFGIALGALGGFLYYKLVGCSSGTCPITSNPYISTLFGAVSGLLITL